MAHKWAQWQHNPYQFGGGGGGGYLRAVHKIRTRPQVDRLNTQPCQLGDPLCFKDGDKIESGAQMGPVAPKPSPCREVPCA